MIGRAQLILPSTGSTAPKYADMIHRAKSHTTKKKHRF